MEWIYLIDFGLVVLIWIVQLVLYPSFKYFPSSELLKAHRAYTAGITVVVMPLMLAQLILHGLRLSEDVSFNNGWMLLLVLSTWLTTFTIFVPLHNKITLNQNLEVTLSRLVKFNWIRTVTWSVIFLWNFLSFTK